MLKYTAKEYLFIDIANNLSKELDRSNFEDRINFIKSYSLSDLYKMKHDAENPCLFEAGLLAYQDMLDDKPSGYPISLDMCASGISILSLLTNCASSAYHTGLLGDKRQDVYSNIFSLIGSELTVEHKDLKQSIMTFFYSSEAQYKKLLKFDENKINQFHDIMHKELTGPYNARYYLESLWDETKYINEWIMPDNFHVSIPVMEKETKSINFEGNEVTLYSMVNKPSKNYRSIAAHITHSTDAYIARELHRRCNYNQNHINYLCNLIGLNNKSYDRPKDNLVLSLVQHFENTNIQSIRILDYLDKDNIGLIEPEIVNNLILSLPENRFDMLSIHDCFKCLPRYGNDLRNQFNIILHSIANSNLLENITYQLTGNVVKFDKDQDYIENIKHSQYGLS